MFHRLLPLAAALACPCPALASAQDFTVPPADTTAHDRALTCMAQAIAYEAGYEPLLGKQAVAEVILNRTHNPIYPASVCGVVYQGSERPTGCQFTFTCDGSLRRRLPDRVMDEARQVASDALDHRLPTIVSGAINYHADYVLPYWAPTMLRVTRIGRHIFYRPFGTPVTARAPEYTPGIEPAVAGTTHGEAPHVRQATAGFSLWGLAPPGAIPR